ncbi:MAG: MFS transporter [Kiritimatiellae bacterium]|nr:MFS transporter [Kiritimatiellia bacterium]
MRRLAVPLVGAFASGMVPGLVAAALAFLPTGDAAKSTFVSAAMCGMIAASIAGGFLADRLGRVRAMRLAGWIALLATPFLCVSQLFFAFAFAGRFVQGFGLGLFSVLLPLYIAETQPDNRRGRATAFYQFSNSLGGIVGALCGFAVAGCGLSQSVAWRLDVLMVAPILVVFLVGSRWLKEEELVGACLRRARSPLPVGACIPHARRLVLAMVVLALTSATGIGSVMHYSVTMMTEAGLTGSSANAADAVMRVCGLVAALLSAAFIDRRGRAFVLKIGTAGSAVSLFAAGALFFGLKWGLSPFLGASIPIAGLGVAALLCLFVAFFSFGPGVCVWVVAAELLPASVRAKGMSFALLGNQIVTAAIASVFLPIASRFGYAPLFFAFALAAAAYFTLVSIIPTFRFLFGHKEQG